MALNKEIIFFLISDTNKLLTTFVDRTSTKRASVVTPPRELRKFQDLHILDATCGLHHILIFAALKNTIFTSLDNSSSDANDNGILVQEPPAVKSINNNIQQRSVTPSDTSPQTHVLTKQSALSKIPILTRKSAEIQQSDETDPSSSQASIDTVIHVKQSELTDDKTLDLLLEKTASLNEFEKLEMDSAMNAISGVGKLVEHEVTTEVNKVVTDGMKQMNEIKDKTIETIKEAPKEAMKVIDTEIIKPASEKIHELNEKKNEVINDVVDSVKGKTDSVIQTLESKFHMGDSTENMNTENEVLFKKNETLKNNLEKDAHFEAQNGSGMEKHREKVDNLMSKDEKIEVHLKEENGKITSSIKNGEDVTFINDGIDVTNDVAKCMKDEIDEMDQTDEMVTELLSKKEDSLLGEKLISIKPTPSNLLDSKQSMYSRSLNTRNAIILIAILNVLFTALIKKGSIEGTYIPLKGDLKPPMEEIDLDGDGERTTASIKSMTPAKNPFESDEEDSSITKQVDKMGSKVTSAVREGEGRVKRFFKEIKNKSNCKNADTAIENAPNIDPEKSEHSEYAIDNKTSKVCTIL